MEQKAIEDHQRVDRVRHHDWLIARDDRDAVEDRKREEDARDPLVDVPRAPRAGASTRERAIKSFSGCSATPG